MKRSLHSRLVLQPVDPRRQRRRWLAEALAVLLAIVAGFVVTRYITLDYEQQRRVDVSELRDQLADAQAQQVLLESRLALAQRGQQMTQRANEELRTMLNGLQREYGELEAELGFFRELADASADERALSVYQVARLGSSRADTFRLRVALTQGLDAREPASGRLFVSVVGREDDTQRSLSLSQLTGRPGNEGREVRFRYFQQEIFDLRLPEGFEPEQLVVRLLASQGEGELLRRVYDWQDIETR